MKCPKCKKKMVYDKDKKDYFCEHCELSLKSLNKKVDTIKKDNKNEPEQEVEETQKDKEKIEEQEPLQPLAGTPRGIMFMMLGSLILILNPVLIFICQLFPIIGLFLVILGFFLVYQDKVNYSSVHVKNMKFAVIIFTAWLIIYLLTNVYLMLLSTDFGTQLNKYNSNETIPKSIIIDYFNEMRTIAYVSFPTVSLLAVFRYLTIKELISTNLKRLLEIAVILLVLSGFISMYLTLGNIDETIDNLGENTREEFENSDLNYTTDEPLSSNQYLYGLIFLNTSAEAIMIMCYYWTYKIQKEEFEKQMGTKKF